jgi:DNA-directed RNA polymerase beta' subunit
MRKKLGPAEPGKAVPPFPLTPAENVRRAELIGKHVDGTIAADEQEELDRLQALTRKWGSEHHEATRGDFMRRQERKLRTLLTRLKGKDGRDE